MILHPRYTPYLSGLLALAFACPTACTEGAKTNTRTGSTPLTQAELCRLERVEDRPWYCPLRHPPTTAACPAPPASPPKQKSAGTASWGARCLATVTKGERRLSQAITAAKRRRDIILVNCLNNHRIEAANIQRALRQHVRRLTPGSQQQRAIRAFRTLFQRFLKIFRRAGYCASG